MKVTDLLTLDHHAARRLTKTIDGAKEIPTPADARLVQVSDEVSNRLYTEAMRLYEEAIMRGLLSESDYGLDDWHLEADIVAAITAYAVNTPNPDDDNELALLERLWGVLPTRYRKKTGKVLRIEDTTVTLTLRPGRRKYVFTFPLSHFEV